MTATTESAVEDRRATITVDEAADLLGISRCSAYNAVNKGEIPSIRIGRRLLVSREALERKLATAGGPCAMA